MNEDLPCFSRRAWEKLSITKMYWDDRVMAPGAWDDFRGLPVVFTKIIRLIELKNKAE